ncbi:exo-alpha-sialidase [candidate division KSB1 bacterium]|nr:exo-alpha-sialidase [candidate division KSB1 bacterium]
MIKKFSISRDDSIYQAWPDVVLTTSGKLICIFSECTHHGDRSYTRIMLCDSLDRGRTWTPKRALSEPTQGLPFWNCARIMQLSDGRIAALVDKIYTSERDVPEKLENYLFFSADDGQTWDGPHLTPAQGIVPDKLLELKNGRWILSCQYRDPQIDNLVQRLWYSDDKGKTWSEPVIVGRMKGLNLCEVSILPVEGNTLVAFHRENSGLGWDCFKTISFDNGESWGDPIRFPLPGCHRPVAGWLKEGKIMITHRFMQGGRGWGKWTQNFFAAITDKESALAATREQAWTRILPVDFDRSPKSDLGYSGWVQFEDGEIYIVNYILDDAPKGQIRGYSLTMADFVLE